MAKKQDNDIQKLKNDCGSETGWNTGFACGRADRIPALQPSRTDTAAQRPSPPGVTNK